MTDDTATSPRARVERAVMTLLGHASIMGHDALADAVDAVRDRLVDDGHLFAASERALLDGLREAFRHAGNAAEGYSRAVVIHGGPGMLIRFDWAPGACSARMLAMAEQALRETMATAEPGR